MPSPLESVHSPECTHAQLEDDPPVAATESGGPPISPGQLTKPTKYKYEVVTGFFAQDGGKSGEPWAAKEVKVSQVGREEVAKI